MNAKQKRRNKLLAWRARNLVFDTPEEFADGFSVERLPYRSIPFNLQEAVTEFRHLSQKARRAACVAFLRR